MRQEHPFFYRPQITYGKPIEKDEEEEEALWFISFEEPSHLSTGLFLLWTEALPSEEDFSIDS